MIARPVHRPHPIPFEAPFASSAHTAPRPVSWMSALGAAGQAAPGPGAPQRLSPVRVSITPSNTPSPPRSPCPPQRQASTTRADNPHTLSEISACYVGHGALSVRSSVTGKHYRFQGHGDSLVIDRHDVVLLKRIADLVIR